MYAYPGANVHAKAQTGDTSFTLACENGHTDVAEVLLIDGSDLVGVSLLSTLFLVILYATSTIISIDLAY